MKSNITVLQVLPALEGGGVERGTLEIAEALIAQGHRALVASSGGKLVAALEAMGAEHVILPVHSKNPLQIWRNQRALAALCKSHNVDLIHVRSRAPAWSCLLAARQSNTPYIATFHGQYGHANRFKRWYNSAMLRGKACIAVSDFIADHISNTYSPLPPLHTIYRGIDLSLFDPERIPPPTLAALRSAWQIDASEPLLLLPGRLTRLKGHHLLIDAMATLHNAHLQVRIVGDMTGRERYVAECKARIDQAGLSDRVRFVGACQDMATAYAISDIVVSASTKPEAFGRTICEAQAMGCLVVAADHGGARETLQASQPQGLFKPGDSSALAAAIKRQLSLSHAARQRSAQTSREHIARHFNLHTMQAQTLALYASVLDQDH